MVQPRISHGEWGVQTPLGFWDTNGLPRRPDRVIVNKKRTCRIVDFAVLADHRVKSKESEKKDKNLDLARELKKKLWNRNDRVRSIVTGALGTVNKGQVRGLKDLKIRERVVTIKTTALLRSARILGRVLKTWGDLSKSKVEEYGRALFYSLDCSTLPLLYDAECWARRH